MVKPFSSAAVYDGKLILAPYQGNMFICLDPKRGKMVKWEPPIELPDKALSGYFSGGCRAGFGRVIDSGIPLFEQPFCRSEWVLYSNYNTRYYRINLQSNETQEIQIEFNMKMKNIGLHSGQN